MMINHSYSLTRKNMQGNPQKGLCIRKYINNFNTNFESKIRTKRLELLRDTPTSA